MKSLPFDANEVSIEAMSANIIRVDIETDYPDEILSEFSTDEIIKNYSDLDELYEALKEYFGDD